MATMSRLLVAGLIALGLGRVAESGEPWHLAGWKARALVEIAEPAENDVDTAAVRVLCHGRGKADGSDYRVLDAAGKPVPFQVTFHNAPHDSWIAFRAARPKRGERFFVYFGNEQAERAAEEVGGSGKPGGGPPSGAWTPRAGLLYATMHRPEGKNPETVDELAMLIAESRTPYGARYQRRVADGHNPFGPSDNYISLYRGWIKIPQTGTYRFCTASNEASFSFLDGKELVHWPGRHTEERGIHGEENAAVELTAGLHYLEYYHEEVTLRQMAFLGWSPPGSPEGQFTGIPESVYTAPHAATAVAYESPEGPLLTFEPAIVDSLWPAERHEGQYTRVRFRAAGLPEADRAAYRWEFGDGQSQSGSDVEHVYLRLGDYKVTLSAESNRKKLTAELPLEIYEIQHVTDEIQQGRPGDYAKITAGYDVNALDAASLKELAHLYQESEQPAESIRIGKLFVERHSAAHPELLPKVQRLIAFCALELGDAGVDEAIASFQASLTDATPAAERLDSLARLMRLVGIERNAPEKTKDLLVQVEEIGKSQALDADAKAAYRRAIIAAGDVVLWHGKRVDARDLYKRAEVLSGQIIPEPVRAARIGAFPSGIRELLSTNDYDAALALVDQWDETFPTDKVRGETFFWRGKILSYRGQHREAARALARAIGLTVGAAFETEARWLLADSLSKLGREKESRAELAKLIASGLNDRYTARARERLAESARKE
jgi:hypothetical protein